MHRIAPSSPDTVPTLRSRRATAALWLIGLVFVIALGAALKAMAAVMIPVVLAVLVALVFAPLHARLAAALPERLGGLALVVVMVALVAVIAVFIAALVYSAQQVLDVLPDMSGEGAFQLPQDPPFPLSDRMREIWSSVSGALGGWLVDGASQLAQAVVGATGGFFTSLVLVVFLVLLALSERGVWHCKISALWPGEGQSRWRAGLTTLTWRLQRFLVVRTVIGIVQAALYVGWLWLFGVDLLIVWGVLSFLLTYIPNFGAIIAGALPTLYAFITKDPLTALGVAAGITAIEQLVGNFLDPRLLGRQIALSPLVILIGLLFWSWLWGVAGAFLSTPLMLSLLIAFNEVSALRPLALVVSNQPDQDALDRALAEG